MTSAIIGRVTIDCGKVTVPIRCTSHLTFKTTFETIAAQPWRMKLTGDTVAVSFGFPTLSWCHLLVRIKPVQDISSSEGRWNGTARSLASYRNDSHITAWICAHDRKERHFLWCQHNVEPDPTRTTQLVWLEQTRACMCKCSVFRLEYPCMMRDKKIRVPRRAKSWRYLWVITTATRLRMHVCLEEVLGIAEWSCLR